jgi:phosphoribosylamine--glycine ligase
MRVCVVGGGGREHALAVGLARTADVVVTPGNAGMAALGVTCLPDPASEIEADLYVIGPEVPLVDGLADRLRHAGKLVFGPGADGARLEGSKAWMKDVLGAASVPTAAHGVFAAGEEAEALDYLRSLPGPWVIKTDGLAAGKGVLVADDIDRAEADLRAKLSGRSFGAAGTTVVIEEGLEGTELSVMAVCDGRTAVALAPAQDFKRAEDGDQGPNTGGMGAYSPVRHAGPSRADPARADPAQADPFQADPSVVDTVMEKAVRPTLAALAERGVDYRGVLYAGVMLTVEGPKVLEFNVRFGDPETQVVIPRWQGDIAAVLAAAARGRLDDTPRPTFNPDASVCVVLAAPGYPEAPRTGDGIEGFRKASEESGIRLYCAGIAAGPGESLVTAGGRVLAVEATAPSVAAARRRVYESVPLLSWPGMKYRTDIAAAAAA